MTGDWWSQRTLILHPLLHLQPVFHGARLGGHSPGKIATGLTRIGSLGHGHAPLGAVGGEFDLENLASGGEGGEKAIATAVRLDLGPMDRLVGLELGPEQRIGGCHAQPSRGLAVLTVGEAGKIIPGGGPLGLEWRRQEPQGQRGRQG